MHCVEENYLEINLMQISFAQICFVLSNSKVEVTDNLYEMKDIGCGTLYFNVWGRDIQQVPDASLRVGSCCLKTKPEKKGYITRVNQPNKRIYLSLRKSVLMGIVLHLRTCGKVCWEYPQQAET